MTDLMIAYDVPGVPGLQLGVTDTGQAAIVIADESVLLARPDQIAAVQLGLEQVRADQERVLRGLHPEWFEDWDARKAERDARGTRRDR